MSPIIEKSSIGKNSTRSQKERNPNRVHLPLDANVNEISIADQQLAAICER
jgi:hypothetical protein